MKWTRRKRALFLTLSFLLLPWFFFFLNLEQRFSHRFSHCSEPCRTRLNFASIINDPKHRTIQCKFYNPLATHPEDSCAEGEGCDYVHLSKTRYRREKWQAKRTLQAVEEAEHTPVDQDSTGLQPTEGEGENQPLSGDQPPAVPPAMTQPSLGNQPQSVHPAMAEPSLGDNLQSPRPMTFRPQTPLSQRRDPLSQRILVVHLKLCLRRVDWQLLLA